MGCVAHRHDLRRAPTGEVQPHELPVRPVPALGRLRPHRITDCHVQGAVGAER